MKWLVRCKLLRRCQRHLMITRYWIAQRLTRAPMPTPLVSFVGHEAQEASHRSPRRWISQRLAEWQRRNRVKGLPLSGNKLRSWHSIRTSQTRISSTSHSPCKAKISLAKGLPVGRKLSRTGTLWRIFWSLRAKTNQQAKRETQMLIRIHRFLKLYLVIRWLKEKLLKRLRACQMASTLMSTLWT